jgi:hypothetical protein
MSTLYSLLIGIDHYFGYPLDTRGLHFGKLGGCVRDINKVYDFLTTRVGVQPANILKLTATAGQDRPLEPQNQWPTYRNIYQAFTTLAQQVQPGDQVYFQYSGHGGRTRTMFPDLKQADGFDEAIAPLDIGKPGDPWARYLRDVELHTLIEQLKAKDVRLTMVFDCCHSGGITRGDVAVTGVKARGLSAPDESTMPPSDSLLGDLTALTTGWGAGSTATRSVQTETSWLFEPKGYTLFSACRSNESAFEAVFQDGESNGALTYWLLDTLNKAGPRTTWQMVADRVGAKVHGQFERQTPMLQGEGDFVVFGADRWQRQFAVGVRKVEASSGRVLLSAGEAQGVGIGSEFGIYAHDTEDFDQAPLKATAIVQQLGATDAWAGIQSQAQPSTLEVGDQAVLRSSSEVRLRRAVAVAVEDLAQKALIEAAITNQGKGFIGLVSAGQQGDFQVAVNPDAPDEYALWDSSGASLPKITPPIRRADPGAADKLVKRLIHLARYRNVAMLDLPAPVMQKKLKVEWIGNPVAKVGDKLTLQITNLQNKGADNDASRILNITVLDLSDDWSITQIYPQGGGFEALDPGASLPIELQAWLPDGQEAAQDTIKIFATRATTQFHWLELPSLDQQVTPKGTTRDLITDPLEAMLALITGEENPNPTRAAVRLSTPQDQGWEVAQVKLVVQR